MAPNERARKNHDELFPGHVSTLAVTDPEFIETFDNFAFDEVLRHGNIDVRTRLMVQLAAIIACQALREYRVMLGAGSRRGHSGRSQGDPVPGGALRRHGQGPRFHPRHERGAHRARHQAAAAGPVHDHAREPRREGPCGPEADHRRRCRREALRVGPRRPVDIQRYLSANCFDDNYTRTGIDVPTRELLTFSMLAALGGCEPQVKGDVAANLGSATTATLIDVLTSFCRSSGTRARSTHCGRSRRPLRRERPSRCEP